MLKCDILIVGAGPAGAQAATEAAKHGLDVVVIDKQKSRKQGIHRAEFIPKLLAREVRINSQSIAQEVSTMQTYMPNGECFEINSPGYILNREVFDKELVVDAINGGAKILTGTICIAQRNKNVIAKSNGEEIKIYAKIIIGADGAKSTVGKWINSINTDFVYTLQCELPLTNRLNHTEIYFDHRFTGGYGWLFPRGKTANVGIGISQRQGVSHTARMGSKKQDSNLRKLLEYFIGKLRSKGKIKGSTPISMAGGLIPVGGPLTTVKENIMLVGDAAGQTHPITGAGILQAIVCGKIAGRVAAESINHVSNLVTYEKEWKELFGEELERARIKRKLLDSHWHDLNQTIKKCWPIFKDYYD